MKRTKQQAIMEPANETESRLLDCALTLFASQGYAATSVRDIIGAAGVTQPVLYYYCKNKEDLFRRLVRWKHDNAYEGLANLRKKTTDCAERLRILMRGSFAFSAADPRVPQLMFQTFYGPPIEGIAEFIEALTARRYKTIVRIMADGLSDGTLDGGTAESLALIFCCVMDQHINIYTRIASNASALTPQLADHLLDVFLRGAGTDRSHVSKR